MGSPRCRDPSVWIDPAKVDRVASLLRQLFQIVKLRTAIALPERVNIVDIADDLTGSRGKAVLAQPAEAIGFIEPSANVFHAGLDKLTKLELMTALRDFDGANLACPVVNILK